MTRLFLQGEFYAGLSSIIVASQGTDATTEATKDEAAKKEEASGSQAKPSGSKDQPSGSKKTRGKKINYANI